MKMTIGERIRELRKQQRMPSFVLAKRARVSHNTIWLLECYNLLPRRASLERIAQALGTTYEELFAELPDEPQEVSQP